MGLNISRDRFEEHEFQAFAARLRSSLPALAELLKRPDFGSAQEMLGAELELSLVDAAGIAAPINARVLDGIDDPRFTVELNRFNLEYNATPVMIGGQPFNALERELGEALDTLRARAAAHGARIAQIGILPTLRPDDLESSAMTDLPRYRALASGIRRLRQKPFNLHIEGQDKLSHSSWDVTYEGANTSFQVHLCTRQAEFIPLYNAVQLATAPALAVSGNSPTFLGCRLWEETRIALFKKAVDDRLHSKGPERAVPRVSFGLGWLHESALELFSESVHFHEPLLPVLSDEDALAVVRSGGVPQLAELRLHNGTVWRWNRPIYDPSGTGHLRIELRSLPAGPTIIDMLANAAFHVGLALELATRGVPNTRLTFEAAHGSFYRAAKQGLAAELLWPQGGGVVTRNASELVNELLPLARAGLASKGVERAECDRLLDVIGRRAETGQTGAAWQRKRLAHLERDRTRQAALARLFEEYLDLSESGMPVHTWP